MIDTLSPVLIGLLPVLLFLLLLIYLDSYKLVALPLVMAVLVAGACVAALSYTVNLLVLDVARIEFSTLSRYVAPVSEEALKAIVVLILIRLRRIGFLVDGAILGFAVGAGFAVVENAYYYLARLTSDAGLGLWLVRGFGTALMHGGTTAIFAVIMVGYLDHTRRERFRALVLGAALAILLHAAYNHALLRPAFLMLIVLGVLPAIFYFVFRRNEQALGDWLGKGFDADAEMLELLKSGRLSDSPLGHYLASLKDRFHGAVMADILCYIRLFTELALRAKGILMMRENGFEPQIDSETKEKFAELEYLERSIGRTGLMAIQPMLHFRHKDLWQLYMIGK